MEHIVIVGGGMAGLATAYYLQSQARQARVPVHYTLLEADTHLGGKITTYQADGFTIEGGPDSFITQKPQALALCRELGLESELIGTNSQQRRVYVLRRGRLLPLPEGMIGGIPTQFLPFVRSPLISPLGKVRMGLDLLIPPRTEDGDESVGHFFRRRLGREAVDRLAEPLLAGIHVADADRLSLSATFPRFRQVEQRHGSLVRGMIAARRQPSPANDRGERLPLFMTLRDGLQRLVAALVERLEGDIRTGQRVVQLRYQRGNGQCQSFQVHLHNGDTLRAGKVVLAVPAYVAADLVEPFQPQLATRLRSIRYVSSATLSLVFPRVAVPHPLDGTGFLIPASEQRRILACTWSSVKFGHRAPEGSVLLRCFIGGSRDEHLLAADDTSLQQMAQDELRRIMGITAEPQIARLFRWERANPQYDVGHLERVSQIEAWCAATPGLYLTGSPYRGIGLPDCIAQGQQTATQLLAINRVGAPI